ncbi:hypothetical protein QLX08_011374 [Tetragonisca angustula]|uniref:Uncharacterized protein n=1 Tax=Tetragonisca angustula TaxID=166442 RepID=A0AAW0Z8H1_9HYME
MNDCFLQTALVEDPAVTVCRETHRPLVAANGWALQDNMSRRKIVWKDVGRLDLSSKERWRTRERRGQMTHVI